MVLTPVRNISTPRLILMVLATLILALSSATNLQAQRKNENQSGLSNLQRLDVMRSKLDAMRRSLDNAIAGLNAKDAGDSKKNPDDPRERLRSLEKEVGSVLSEVNDLHSKEEHAEKYDASKLDGLETSVAELNTRVEAGLQATAGARTSADATSSNYHPKPQKGKRRLLGLLPGKSQDKYAELTGSVAPGRDRVLFVEAAKEVRKGNHETGRLLFTTIINTYPDSAFLPLAKLAIADSFYLEGTTSALIQAAQAYLDWLTFFPTDPLADDAMLKVAEAEMRQMGLSDRDITHARKAEQRLKSLLQQYPQTKLRPQVQERLNEVQENLAMHDYQVGDFYLTARYKVHGGGLKGAQSRFKDIVEKYPCFSYMDEVLYKLGYTYQQEEEPDEAAKYYQQLLRYHSDSQYADKAKEQLNIIGAPLPEAAPNSCGSKPERPTFMGNLMQQVSGRADVSVDKDGILISKDGKEGTDLIDEAMKYNGQLPANVTPVVQSGTPRPAPTKKPTPQPGTVQNTAQPGTIAPAATPSPGIKP